MLNTEQQRRAYFAKLKKTQRRVFPVHGDTRRTRTNRAFATLVGLGVGGPALLLATKGGRRGTGPFRGLLGLTGRNYTASPKKVPGPLDYVFHGGIGRPATRAEIATSKFLRWVAPGMTRKLRRGMGIMSYRPRVGSPRVYVAWGTPLDTRAKIWAKRWLARRVERASLANALGENRLVNTIEEMSLRAQQTARKGTRGVLNKLAERAEEPVRRAFRRVVIAPWGGANRRLARVIRGLGRKLAVRAAARIV